MYKKFGSNNNPLSSKKAIIIFPVIYAIIMVIAYVSFPPNPDKVTTISTDLILNFRIAGAFTIGLFWGLLGIILGSFWDKLKPHQTSKITSI